MTWAPKEAREEREQEHMCEQCEPRLYIGSSGDAGVECNVCVPHRARHFARMNDIDDDFKVNRPEISAPAPWRESDAYGHHDWSSVKGRFKFYTFHNFQPKCIKTCLPIAGRKMWLQSRCLDCEHCERVNGDYINCNAPIDFCGDTKIDDSVISQVGCRSIKV